MTPMKDQISPNWPTIFELASTIQEVNLYAPASRRTGGQNRRVVTHGLIPQPFPVQEGFFSVTPEQIASLRVPRTEVGSEIRGFQREKINVHARKIARALLDGAEMPPIECSIFPDEQVYVGEGQHRCLGAIIARKSLEVVVKRRSVEQARQLFANQSRAKKLKSDDTLLTGNSAIELYLQDALTREDHPWSPLVSAYPSQKMTPTSMVICVGSYVHNTMSLSTTLHTTRTPEEFYVRLADQLARLIACFGTKTTNPFAFRAKSLRAISFAGIHIFRRNEHAQPGDEERWRRHMPTLEFARFVHILNREVELSLIMVDHWNKRLPEARRVTPVTYR
jgi:hypothetical protein